MCFRPAEANVGVNCPECGKKINYTQGMLPKKCPFCKTSLEGVSAPTADTLTAPKAPGAPGAPKAPAPPGTSKPPIMPSASKPPQVPGAPKPPTP